MDIRSNREPASPSTSTLMQSSLSPDSSPSTSTLARMSQHHSDNDLEGYYKSDQDQPPPLRLDGFDHDNTNEYTKLSTSHQSHQSYGALGSRTHSPMPQLFGQPFQTAAQEEELNARFENLQDMRPYHLIGRSVPWADWAQVMKSEAEINRISNKKVQKYYRRQNKLCQRYMEIDELLDSGISLSMLRVYGDDLQRIHQAPEDQRQGAPANIDVEGSPLVNTGQKEASGVVMFAIYVNFVVNIVLLIGKVVVAVLTNSLSVIASLVDSVLDFMSTLIIWFSTRLVEQSDWRTKHLYPVGRNRLEPIGVLVFSILIIVSFLQIANEALQKLWKGNGEVVTLGTPSIIIMSMTVIVKVFCYLWCRTINSSAVQALAQDAMTDIVFNTFSILFPLMGHYTNIWWFDPLGALFLSCYIIYSWGGTALEHIDNLTGAAASDDDRQVLLYASARFAESIRQITNLYAYHTGDLILVEVDLVLDRSLNLKDSHDIGEALQYALETLPFVERAFVHLDYRTGNFTGHLANQ